MTKQLSPLEALKIIYDLEDLQGCADYFKTIKDCLKGDF